MIKEISHVVIYTTDMEKSLEFYGNKLGLEIASKSPYWSEIKVPSSGTYIGLHAVESPNPKKSGTTEVSFMVDNIKKAQQWLETNNIKITREANEIAPGTWVVNFDDPDGNPLSLYTLSA